jgi:hypothetical protein
VHRSGKLASDAELAVARLRVFCFVADRAMSDSLLHCRLVTLKER